jgi:hypothetical protein
MCFFVSLVCFVFLCVSLCMRTRVSAPKTYFFGDVSYRYNSKALIMVGNAVEMQTLLS